MVIIASMSLKLFRVIELVLCALGKSKEPQVMATVYSNSFDLVRLAEEIEQERKAF